MIKMQTVTLTDYTTDFNDIPLIDAPLPHHIMGLQYTASGYGAKIPTRYKVRFNNRLYRVYATCYGNASSTWIKANGCQLWLR